MSRVLVALSRGHGLALHQPDRGFNQSPTTKFLSSCEACRGPTAANCAAIPAVAVMRQVSKGKQPVVLPDHPYDQPANPGGRKADFVER